MLHLNNDAILPRMTEYSNAYYEMISNGTYSSAAALVPIVNNILHPKSVLDVGCGQGGWLRAWQANGVDNFLGVDGDYVDRKRLVIPKNKFRPYDLKKPLKLKRKFDLVMTLEVAEHLEKEYAGIFINSLVQHSDVILFSAAIPGQLGTHHVNEQWPSYWVKLFATRGYKCFDILRPKIWTLSDIEISYRQNTMIFATKQAAKRLGLEGSRTNRPLDIAHPELFALRANQPATQPEAIAPVEQNLTQKQMIKKLLKDSPAGPTLQKINRLRVKIKNS